MSGRWQWSTRAHLLGLPAIVLMPVVVFAGIVVWQFAGAERTRAQHEAVDTAHRLSTLIDRDLTRTIGALQALATTRLIDEGQFERLQRVTSEVGEALGGVVVIKDTTGRQLVNSSQPAGTALPTVVQDWDRQAMETRKPVVSDLFTAPIAKVPVIAVYVPILRDDVPIGTVVSGVEVAHFNRLLATGVPADWTATLVDRADIIVARSRQHEQFVGRLASEEFRAHATGQQGPYIGRTLENIRVLAGYVRSPVSGLRVAVGVPLDVVQAPFRQLLWSLLGLGLALLFLSLLLARTFGRMITKPMHQLAVAAAALGHGHEVTPPRTRLVEIDEVSGALERASHELAAAGYDREMMIRELSHRSKNLLAVIQAIARQTAKSSRSVDVFEPSFLGRLHSLSKVHDLLVADDWRGARLEDVVATQLAPFVEAARIDSLGPDVTVSPSIAQNLSLALHELATNAVKYGSLSIQSGTVAIRWRIESGALPLVFTWTERGGPTVAPPQRRGFGTMMLERMSAGGVGGVTELRFHPDGVIWTLQMPMGG